MLTRVAKNPRNEINKLLRLSLTPPHCSESFRLKSKMPSGMAKGPSLTAQPRRWNWFQRNWLYTS
jgi:hypothetical protein